MRVMVRQGFSKDLADLFLEDYKRMLSFFEKHPVSSPTVSYTHLDVYKRQLQYGEQCVPIDAADTEDREIFR